jgi:RNase P/RNase MRP subunit p30
MSKQTPTPTKIVQGKDADFNRIVLERKDTKALILNHKDFKHDKLYERDSGLNQVLCKIAKKNDIEFQIDFNEIKKTSGLDRARILSRIRQNLMLFKKFHNKFKVINFKKENKRAVQALLIALGSPTQQAADAVK